MMKNVILPNLYVCNYRNISLMLVSHSFLIFSLEKNMIAVRIDQALITLTHPNDAYILF